ncbi:XdhC family protein [Kordiimonas sp.]|uniref:XdhC family protein n=1 Tax=Kordiimonas sp. TaxID=1970157 RepID=UPI003A9088AE
MIDILYLLMEELGAGRTAAVAVVTATWGSAPRQAGSMMLVRSDGSFEGSVSGGCVEGSVIAEATSIIGQGSSKRLTYAVSNDNAFAVGLACGGTIHISLFPLGPDSLHAISATMATIADRQQGVLSLHHTGQAAHFERREIAELADSHYALRLPVRPKPRLDIIGAVHIAQALASMAAQCGFDVTVVDPRSAFTEARCFADALVITDWPDEYFIRTPPDSTTAVVTLTHDPKLDDTALMPALGSKAFYIGCLGSKKTHAERLARLQARGVDEKVLERIHGPVGLNIGSKTPAEIAVSILSQIIQSQRTGAAYNAV